MHPYYILYNTPSIDNELTFRFFKLGIISICILVESICFYFIRYICSFNNSNKFCKKFPYDNINILLIFVLTFTLIISIINTFLSMPLNYHIIEPDSKTYNILTNELIKQGKTKEIGKTTNRFLLNNDASVTALYN